MTKLHQQIREAGRKFRICEIGLESSVRQLLDDPSPYVRMLAQERLERQPEPIIALPKRKAIPRSGYSAYTPKNGYMKASEVASLLNISYDQVRRIAIKLNFVWDYRKLHLNAAQVQRIRGYEEVSMDNMLPVSEARAYTGIKSATFYSLIKTLGIKHFKKNRKSFYLKSDLDRMVSDKNIDGLLDMEEAAKYVGMSSVDMFKRCRRLDPIPFKRVNVKLYFDKTDLDKWERKK